MFKTVVLICSLSTHPDPATCTRETAIDVVSAAPSRNAMMCGLFGQAGIATTAVKPEAGKSYMKIVCERVREEAAR